MRKKELITNHTKKFHKDECSNPIFDWKNKQDFEFASRGLIHRPDDADIRNKDNKIVWHHESFEKFLKGNSPETVHPSLWRHALLNNFRGLFKVCNGVYQVRGESLANVTFVETNSGYVVIDPLTTVETASYALQLLFDHVGKKKIVGMIYSHTHSDHFGGVKGMISEDEVLQGNIKVIASEGFTEWVLKEQGMAAEGMPSRNDYMYGENLEVSPFGIVDTGLGQMIEGGEISYIEPTDVIGKDGGSIKIDGLEFEFMFAPGEAPTGMHCYIPKYKTLHVADNCYMCLHNVYTIRGAFPRDAMQWSDSVARSLLFEDTEYLISGHNWPVFGKKEIRKFLGEQRDGIKYMHDQTLRLMSHGYIPSEIANKINFPDSLARLWHLRGYYGALKHNVQGIYAYYLGWYDGNPANLDKLPPRELAIKTLEYMGGINNVLKRTKIDFEKGEYRWVVYILDQILWAYPDNTEAKELAALTHTQLGFSSENATWRNAYLSAAQELREGIPSEGKNHRILRDVLKGMSPILLLNSLSIRINGPKAENKFFTINWKIKNSNIACHSELTNCVLVNREGMHNKAEVTVKITKDKLSQFALGEMKLSEINNEIEVIGDGKKLNVLNDILDIFPEWFPIATHSKKIDED